MPNQVGVVPDLPFFLDKVSCVQADVKLKAKDDAGVLFSTSQLHPLSGELQACTTIPGLCDPGEQTEDLILTKQALCLLSTSPDVN